MRTTKVAESAGVGVANTDPRVAGGGYSLKPNPNSSGRADAHGLRTQRGTWEVRLGRLQVVVWLGLSIGACFGGYSVGFFSGRHVGFESAREASIGEIPKLPVPEIINNSSIINPNGVYDRLKEPAVLLESDSPRASARIGDISDSSQSDSVVTQQVKNARGAAQLAKQDSARDEEQGGSGGDDIFSDSGDRLVMGSDDVLAAKEGLPSSVRVLGAGVGAEVTKPPLEGIVDQKGDNGQKIPAADVLEERIATARSGVVSKGNLEEKAESKGGLVRRTLPLGYFAQVAAPKKLAEAEGVAKRLKKAGFPVLVESATVNGQGFYRVVVGPEDNKEQVDRLVKQLQKESLAGSSKPFIRRVK